MRSLTGRQRRAGLLSAVVVVTTSGFLLAGAEFGTTGTGNGAAKSTERAPTAIEARGSQSANPGPTSEYLGAGFTPWAINDFLLFTQHVQESPAPAPPETTPTP